MRLTHRDNWRPPKSFASASGSSATGGAMVWLRRDLVHWRDEPALPTVSRAYRRANAVFCRLFSCPHRSRAVPFFGRLDRLAIQDRRTGFGMSSFGLAQFAPQAVVNPLPCSVQAPCAKVGVDRFPRWQVMGNGTPLGTRSQHIQNGIHDFAARMGRRTTTAFGWRNQWFKDTPFVVS